MKPIRLVLSVLSLILAVPALTAADSNFIPSNVKPPSVQREFRAGWVATVANIDWPSAPGLPVDQQKAEMVAIMERAQKTHLNAIVFQVRPACDAMYASTIEPWSYYLAGAMGKPPEPFYDPLQFAIDEAHKRGLELHAWFNPYRAGHPSDKSPVAWTHISKTRPELVKKYGKYLWLDPGEKAVQDYSISVVMDVVKRYDVDGVHMDDYFYPYKETDENKKEIDFPDEISWNRYVADGGKMTKADWRRDNVNVFVQRLYQSVKAAKPWVKVGFAPFGIWQPGVPPGIKKSFDAYNVLYCDSRKWLEEGWLDYCAPQLYWAIEPAELSFTSLLKWWTEQNPKNRNVWPGIDSGKFAEKSPEEIPNQIKVAREISKGTSGVIHWSYKCILNDKGGLATKLEKGLYAEPAVIPASPWLETKGPGKPELRLLGKNEARWRTTGKEDISVWILQTKSKDNWATTILGANSLKWNLPEGTEVVSITAIDRCGLSSPSAVLEKANLAPQKITTSPKQGVK